MNVARGLIFCRPAGRPAGHTQTHTRIGHCLAAETPPPPTTTMAADIQTARINSACINADGAPLLTFHVDGKEAA